jgi:hypothetical protein
MTFNGLQSSECVFRFPWLPPYLPDAYVFFLLPPGGGYQMISHRQLSNPPDNVIYLGAIRPIRSRIIL